MAGTKNLFNADPLEVVLEALELANGIALQREYLTLDAVALNATETQVTLTPRLVGGYSPYVDPISFPINKLNLSPRIPKDMCYSGEWPATTAAFATFMLASYGLMIRSGEWEIQHGLNVYPLDGSILVNPNITSNRILQLRPTWRHPLFTTTMVFPITVTEPDFVFTPVSLSLVGDTEGVVGEPAQMMFVGSGGVEPYTFTVEGQTPVPLNDEGNGLAGNYYTTGVFDYTVEMMDALGQVTQAHAQTDVALQLFTVTQGAPDGVANQPVYHDYELDGGLQPYLLMSTKDMPMGTTLDSVGRLRGWADVGVHTFSANFLDSLGLRFRLQDTFGIAPRDEATIKQDLRDTLVDWLDLGGGYAPGRQLKSYPAASNWIAVDLDYENVVGARAASLKINSGYLVKTGPQVPMTNIAVCMRVVKGYVSMGGTLFSTLDGDSGFEIRVSDLTDYQLRVIVMIDGVPYSFITPSEVEVLTDELAMISVQAAEGVLSVHRNLDLIAWIPIPTTPTTVLGNAPFTIGRQSNFTQGYQWNGTIVRVCIFNQRVWADQLEWLINNDQGRNIRDLIDDDSDEIQYHSVMAPAIVGLPYYDTIEVTGPELEYPILLCDGRLPDGLSMTPISSKIWAISGTPTLAGQFQSRWAGQAASQAKAVTITIDVDNP